MPIVHRQSESEKYFLFYKLFGNILLYIISTNGFEGALLKRTMDSVCNIGFLSLLLSSWFLSALHQCASQTSYWAKAISGKLAKPHKTRENYFRSQKCIQNIGTICDLHKIWFKDGYFWKLFRLMEFLKIGLFHWNLLILNSTLPTACNTPRVGWYSIQVHLLKEDYLHQRSILQLPTNTSYFLNRNVTVLKLSKYFALLLRLLWFFGFGPKGRSLDR